MATSSLPCFSDPPVRRMNRFSDYLSGRLPFFYGYVVVLVAVAAQICSSPGQTFAISAFTPALQESLQLSSSKLSAAYMLGTLLAAFPLFAVGPLSDRWGLRWTTLGVALGLAGACLFASRAQGFLSLIAAFMLLRFLGQGALTLLGSNIVSMWFRQRLGTVNSVMSTGGALAFAVVPILLLESIDAFGWRATYQLMGAVILGLFVPLLLLTLRNRPEDLGLIPDGISLCQAKARLAEDPTTEPELTLVQAARHRTLWILMAGMVLWAMIGTGVVFHAIPIFGQYGVPAEQAKLLFTTFSASMLVAQVAGGILADRLPMHRLLAAGFALLAAGVSVIPFTTSWWHVHTYALLFGAGQGLAIAINSTMWVRYYGRTHLGKIRGTVWCATVAGSGCGPLILGLFVDQLGSFTPGLWLFTALLLPLGPLSLFATAPPRHTQQSATDASASVNALAYRGAGS